MLKIFLGVLEAELKARSEASRQNFHNFYFLREASLLAFSFATLILSKIKVDNKMVTLPVGVKRGGP